MSVEVLVRWVFFELVGIELFVYLFIWDLLVFFICEGKEYCVVR